METSERKTKQADEIFCWSCGEPIKKEAVICVHCGVQVRNLSAQGGQTKTSPAARPLALAENCKPKSKTAAVLLAVFLGYWTWLYTVRWDWPKFAIALGVRLICTPLLMFLMWYLFAEDPALGLSVSPLVLDLPLWIWAVIDRSVKSSERYGAYPSK